MSTTETPAPSYLNPNPNPLQFPTRAEKCRFRDPAYYFPTGDLALRNNRALQEQLNLEAVEARQAAEFPRLDLELILLIRKMFFSQVALLLALPARHWGCNGQLLG